MTECNQSQFEFEAHFSRRVVAEFSGERLTTEGGALLLRAADRKIGLLRRVVRCFRDARDPQRIEDRKSTRLNSSHSQISYAVFCLKKKKSLASLDVRVNQPADVNTFTVFPSHESA